MSLAKLVLRAPLFLILLWSYLPELLVAFYKLQHLCLGVVKVCVAVKNQVLD